MSAKVICILGILWEILLFFFIIPKKILGNKKTLNEIKDFKSNSKTVKGHLDNYLVFLYDILKYRAGSEHGSASVDYFIFLPIVKYVNDYGNEEYVIVQNIEKFKNLGQSVFNYEDLGKEIIVNIDENNIKNMEIDLEKGYFIDKIYTKIDIGDSAEVIKGRYTYNGSNGYHNGNLGKIIQAKLYSAKAKENLLEYLTNLRVVPGIVSELNGINTIEKTYKNTKRFLNIFALICIIVTIIGSFFIVNKML